MKLADRFRRHPAGAGSAGPLAPEAPESAPGPLTPQTRQQLDKSRTLGAGRYAAKKALDALPGAERKNPYPTGPLPVQAVAQAIAKADADAAEHERTPLAALTGKPTFTPKVAETAAQPALPANARVPSRPAAVRADVPELAMLGRVRLGLEKKYRAEAFIADRQMPCFDAAVRTAGWLGLHMPRRRIAVCQYWETETWLKKALAAVTAEADAAEAEIRARNAAWDVVEKQARARRRAAADAAPAALESAQ
jgi:hypothetical protein